MYKGLKMNMIKHGRSYMRHFLAGGSSPLSFLSCSELEYEYSGTSFEISPLLKFAKLSTESSSCVEACSTLFSFASSSSLSGLSLSEVWGISSAGGRSDNREGSNSLATK